MQEIKSFESNPEIFGLNEGWIKFIKGLVLARMNVVVSGGTGMGKTTFLNLLLNEVPSSERIITIEDTLELNFEIPNMVRLEANNVQSSERVTVTTRELVMNSLRMRPDRIIIGEVRAGEVFDLLQAMNTGHEGSMTSVHANSPSECFSRIETLFLLAGFNVPVVVVRKQIAQALDFIIQISKDRDGNRIVDQILEVTKGMEGNNILSQTIAKHENGMLSATGITPKNMAKIHDASGIGLDYFSKIG